MVTAGGADNPEIPVDRLLRAAAIITPDQAARERIVTAAAGVEAWDRVIADAERHGIANLVRRHLADNGVEVPQSCRQQLTALRVRHLRANRTRMAALAEMLQAFDRVGIPSAVLKGAALVNQIYPSPDLRPMGDIDLLVPGKGAVAMRDVLRQLGYHAEDRNRGTLANHHHLPVASRRDNGVDVLVEIHTDALSRDSGGRLDWPRVSAKLRTFEVEGVTGHAPGHLEMLRHLCHHTLEPVERIKLIALADIYGYASQFDAEIPWQILAGEHPFVVNMLTLLGCIAPPPESLRQRIPPLTAPCPRGVGEGYPPLRNTLSSGNPWHDKLRRLMTAPDWWLHCFYNVPPGDSLFTTRTVRHPANVLRWIWRRSVAGLGDRVS